MVLSSLGRGVGSREARIGACSGLRTSDGNRFDRNRHTFGLDTSIAQEASGVAG
jgi:hypothetical protein